MGLIYRPFRAVDNEAPKGRNNEGRNGVTTNDADAQTKP